jgi:hypothetical protein
LHRHRFFGSLVRFKEQIKVQKIQTRISWKNNFAHVLNFCVERGLATLDKRISPNSVVHNATNCVQNMEDLKKRKPQHNVLPLLE